MKSPSPYAHVFRMGEPKSPWPKLKAENRLSMLHAKYWGKDICEEMHQWQNKQTRDQPMNSDKGSISESPANFALYFDIDALNTSRMWVREDYVLLYDHCVDYFNQRNIKTFSKPPSVVITGQPGIGKSYWIFYAARRRLGEKEPFIWYFGLKWYLFVEDGVFQCPEKFSPVPFHQLGLWVLVDADNSTRGVPSEVAESESNLHTIFTTCPDYHRWKVLTKTTHCSVVIMNPWSWEEVHQAAIVHEFTPDDIKDAQRAFDDLGPTARLCIDFVMAPCQLPLYDSHRQSALADFSSTNDLIQAVREIRDLEFDAYYTPFLIRRVDLNPWETGYLQRYTVEPITPYVRQELKFKLMKAMQEERLGVYKRFEAVSVSRPVASVAFESIAQLQLQKEVALTLVPMVKQSPTSRGIAQWKSQFVGGSMPMPISTEDSDSMGAIAANRPHSIRFRPDETIQYQHFELGLIRSGIFYVPRSHQAPLDSFILHNGVLYVFHITIATSHTIDGGVLELFSQETLQTILQGIECHFIFVIPRGRDIECPESSDRRLKKFWKKVKLFSAECDPTNEGSMSHEVEE